MSTVLTKWLVAGVGLERFFDHSVSGRSIRPPSSPNGWLREWDSNAFFDHFVSGRSIRPLSSPNGWLREWDSNLTTFGL